MEGIGIEILALLERMDTKQVIYLITLYFVLFYHTLSILSCLMTIKIIVGEVFVAVLLVFVPQTGLTMAAKELFYNSLQNLVLLETLSMVTLSIHGWYGFGKHTIDFERILEFAAANNLVVRNSKFVKKDDNLIKYQSGGCSKQEDYYILLQWKILFHIAKQIRKQN